MYMWRRTTVTVLTASETYLHCYGKKNGAQRYTGNPGTVSECRPRWAWPKEEWFGVKRKTKHASSVADLTRLSIGVDRWMMELVSMLANYTRMRSLRTLQTPFDGVSSEGTRSAAHAIGGNNKVARDAFPGKKRCPRGR